MGGGRDIHYAVLSADLSGTDLFSCNFSIIRVNLLSMKRLSVVLIGILFLLPSSVRGGDLFKLLRVRVIPNSYSPQIPGDELLELTFRVLPAGWVKGMGWWVGIYDQEKKLVESSSTAFFPRERNAVRMIKGGYLKGPNIFTACFPLPDRPAFVVALLGGGGRIKSTLVPFASSIEEFRIPRQEAFALLQGADYKIPD